MKQTKYFILFSLLFGLSIAANAQQTQKEKERQERKVQIFTPDEADNFQVWFYHETKKMNLPEAVESEYYRIISHYSYDMRRLNDLDKDYTDEEMREKFEKIVTTLNSEVKKVLSADNYDMHIVNFDKTLKAVYTKIGWEWDKN